MKREKIVTFGEIMLRLTPPDKLRFNQTDLLRVNFGGSEANVAVSLANYGLRSELVTCLPDNRIADACLDDLRSYGVGTDHILRGGDRLGLYYMEEAVAMRTSHVVYDRAASSFDTLRPGQIDWAELFADADWFHWSGIAAAVSAETAAVCAEAVAAARRMGLTVSCDINYRKNLWRYGKRAEEVLPPLMEACDILFGTDDEYEKVLGIRLPAFTACDASYTPDTAGYEAAAREVMRRFPPLPHLRLRPAQRPDGQPPHHLGHALHRREAAAHARLRHRRGGRLCRCGRRLRRRTDLRAGRTSRQAAAGARLRCRGLYAEEHRPRGLQSVHGRGGCRTGRRCRFGPHRPLTASRAAGGANRRNSRQPGHQSTAPAPA